MRSAAARASSQQSTMESTRANSQCRRAPIARQQCLYHGTLGRRHSCDGSRYMRTRHEVACAHWHFFTDIIGGPSRGGT